MTEVRAELAYSVSTASTIVLQIGAARGSGRYRIELDGSPVQSQQIEPGVLLLNVGPGQLALHYEATLPRQPAGPSPVSPAERVVALRPSRYCPADRMTGFATDLVGHHDTERDWVLAVCDYVHRYLRYQSGVSDGGTDAVDTLLTGAGVCRDFAHVVAALCRAVGVPARVASVYAPGLAPMDFHLVVEAAVDGHWQVFDATRLAPRPSLVRIATGRDAADVAFATVLTGQAELERMEVVAVADGTLPNDDHQSMVTLA
jgi:transglutaminase-like putative cysteine protease